MTRIYNRTVQKSKRQRLRNEATKAERLLWWRLRGKQLDGMKFRRQYGVGEYVIDLYCPEVKLAIEVDGESHFDPTSRLHDERRLAFLESLGIRVIRFTNPQAYGQLDAVIEEIWRVAKERIAGRGNDPPESPLGKGGGDRPVSPFTNGGGLAPLLNKEGVGGGRNTAKLAPAGNDPPWSPLGKGGGDPPESPLIKRGGYPPWSPLVKGGGL